MSQNLVSLNFTADTFNWRHYSLQDVILTLITTCTL